MNEAHGGYSTDGSEKEEDYIHPNENLSENNDGYMKYDTPVPDRLDYEAIGEKFEIDPNSLTIIQVLGKGFFSDVHMGMLSLPTGKVPVAVKQPQMDTGLMNAEESAATRGRQRQALKDELSIFAHLQSSSTGGHENVLKLLGAITTIISDFCIMTEYCECGSMDRFLQAKWKNGHFEDELVVEANENEPIWKIQRDSKWGEDFRSRRENDLITTSDLLWFALQIARGMQFLTAMNVIHRDIAVRNVLLKLDFTVKIADFGLSRKLKENDNAYYILSKETVLPIRYIAPETLKSGRFSITSEYWSFGVVVWELFTFAEQQPYSTEFDNNENNVHFYDFLAEHLSTGHRLSIPDNCPQQIKSLLSRLWLSDPKRRPSFEVCKKVIRQELMQSCPNILSNEKASHHASEHSIFHLDEEDVNEKTSKTPDYTQITLSASAVPSREMQQTENHDKRIQKRVKRRLLVIVGLVAVLLIAMLIAILFILLYKPEIPDTYNCPTGWVLMSGDRKQCIRVYMGKLNWTDANDECKRHSSHLVSVHSHSENVFILDEIIKILPQGTWGAWMGGHTQYPERRNTSNWYWTDDTNFQKYMNWSPDEPSASYACHQKAEACLHIFLTGYWNDACCETLSPVASGYVCSLDAVMKN